MKAPACPTCKSVAERAGNKLFPFCSERCSSIDLGRWLMEDYRIPGEPVDQTQLAALLPVADSDDDTR